MPLATQVATGFTRVGQEIKALRAGMGGGEDAWEFGPLATASPSYKARAQAANTAPLKGLILSDSTSDGFVGGGINGGSTTWDHVWPAQLAQKLRKQIGLPVGGDGWIPASTPTWPGGYDYDVTTRRPANYTEMDELNFQIGIPGALWLQAGHATNVFDVEYQLSPGTTSVDLVTTGYGGDIQVTCANAASSRALDSTGDRKFTRVSNPGASIRVVGAASVGFALLGIIEYVGDETSGVQMMNLAQASIQAAEVNSWLQNGDMSMKPLIAAYQPDFALIILGSNDLETGGKTPAQTAPLLTSIATQLKSVAPDVEVVFVMRPNPSTSFGQLADLVVAQAPQVNAHVLNLRSEPRLSISNTALYVADKVHFTAAGDTAMAGVVADYLRVEKAGQITEGRVQEIVDLSIGKLAPRIRRMSYGAGLQGNTVTATASIAQRGLRIPVTLWCDTVRWRIRAWNGDSSANTTAKANITNKGWIIGDTDHTDVGLPSGNFTGPTTPLVVGDTVIPGVIPAGNDWYGGVYTSPWFEAVDQQFRDGIPRALGTGIQLASATALQTVEQAGLFFAAAADGIDPTKVNPANAFLPFNFVIEYETVTDKECFLLFGDSIPAGITGYKGAAQTAATPIPSYMNYPQQWARKAGALVQQVCVSGFTASAFSQYANFPQIWDRTDLITPRFDGFIFALGSNDASGGATTAVYRGLVSTIFAKLDAEVLPAGTPKYVVNIAPRSLGTTPEANRVLFNDWWACRPLGVREVVDMDGAMSNGATALRTSASMDGIHFSFTGGLRAATEMRIIPTRQRV